MGIMLFMLKNYSTLIGLRHNNLKWTLKLNVLLYLLVGIVGCMKVPQPCSKSYAFEFPISVTPQDTFIVGDTLWWEMDIPNQLFDTTSGIYVDLTDFEVFLWFAISKLEPNITVTGNGHTHLFDFVPEVGHVEQQNRALYSVYFFTHTTQDKRFKIGCIPTQVGTYNAAMYFPHLYFDGEGFTGEELQIVDPNCKEYITQRSKITINDKELNYHMMEGICYYTSSGIRECYGPQSELPMHSVYAFHVKEP